ncbi:MAG: DUF429 domain-containing protein [Thermoanaerobaculia bacterium]
MKTVVGVDGCRFGWIAVALSPGEACEVRVLPDIHDVVIWRDDGVVLIDVPIGLRDSGPEPRACDVAARRVLGSPRSSSVFPPPCRAALVASCWEEASTINERRTGRRLSRQSWAIAGKIHEVDQFLREDPQRQVFLREAHPEVLFWALNDRRPVFSKKKRVHGRNERLDILTRHWPEVEAVFHRERRGIRSRGAAADDLLDALAAVTAWRACGGRLSTLPEVPEMDAAGLRMEIVLP